MGKESKERAAVSAAYFGERWATKVKNMPDEQIVAVYMRLKQQGRIS
jgi:hypothetical protein